MLFLLPSIIPMCIFWIYPIFMNGFISFTNWDYMSPKFDFVGLDNYKSLFVDQSFYSALWNTLVFAVGVLVPTILGGLLLAVLIFSCTRGKRIYQTLLFAPWITPSVAISIVWVWIYQPDTGIANWILKLCHLPELKWIESSQTAMLSVILLTVWKSIGYAMIFYLAALYKVPKSLGEASKIDGATKWKTFMHITIPLVSPTTFFLSIMTMVQGLQAYDQIQVLTQGGPAGSTRTLLYLFYQLGFEQFQMGKGAAVAVFLVLFTLGLSLLQSYISKKYVHY